MKLSYDTALKARDVLEAAFEYPWMVIGILNCPPQKKRAQQIGQGTCYLEGPAGYIT
jgi:hypothetical protein